LSVWRGALQFKRKSKEFSNWDLLPRMFLSLKWRIIESV